MIILLVSMDECDDIVDLYMKKRLGAVAEKKQKQRKKNRQQYLRIKREISQSDLKSRNDNSKLKMREFRTKMKNARGEKGESLRKKYRIQRKKHNANYYRKKQMESPIGKFKLMSKLLRSVEWDDIKQKFRFSNGEPQSRSKYELESMGETKFLEYVEVCCKGEFIFANCQMIENNQYLYSMITTVIVDERKIIIPQKKTFGVLFGEKHLMMYENGVLYHNFTDIKDHPKFQFVSRKKRKPSRSAKESLRNIYRLLSEIPEESYGDRKNVQHTFSAWFDVATYTTYVE